MPDTWYTGIKYNSKFTLKERLQTFPTVPRYCPSLRTLYIYPRWGPAVQHYPPSLYGTETGPPHVDTRRYPCFHSHTWQRWSYTWTKMSKFTQNYSLIRYWVVFSLPSFSEIWDNIFPIILFWCLSFLVSSITWSSSWSMCLISTNHMLHCVSLCNRIMMKYFSAISKYNEKK